MKDNDYQKKKIRKRNVLEHNAKRSKFKRTVINVFGEDITCHTHPWYRKRTKVRSCRLK